MQYTAIDCFSGCGGLSQGLKEANFKILAGIEINSRAREVHHLNHPDVKLYSDITQIEPQKLMADLNVGVGEIALLAGCPPCQGFSSMRTRNGSYRIKDLRNKLIFDFVRLACELRPKTIMMENVPALLKDWRLYEAKRRLRNAGYKWIVSGILNAAEYGVPQRRKRMILMASSLGPIQLPTAEGDVVITVRQTIGKLPNPSQTAVRLHQFFMRHSDKVMSRIQKIPKDGGSRSDLKEVEQLPCHKRLKGFKDVYGRMRWDDVAPTITRFSHNPSKGRFLHPEQDRAITVYEAMLLQSFPSTYTFPIEFGMGEISSLIGEALPPKFAEAQATHVANHLKKYVQNNCSHIN
jgi:DNA (cytosine-5)-methyltransferase 1